MFEFFFLALGLGIKHSFDADHLLAVSNLLSKAKSIGHTIKMAMSWAVGHMTTAVLVTIVLFSLKDSLLMAILAQLEILVAIMLIVFGLGSLYQARLFHAHIHQHIENKHVHPHLHLPQRNDHGHMHMLGIGIVQGLASNDELLLLLTVSLGLSGLADMVIGVGIFSIGVVVGMIAFSLFLTLPLLRSRSRQLQRWLNIGIGTISIAYGISTLVIL